MNSRDRVLAAFAHQQPDRTPCWCGASEGFWAKAKQVLQLDDEELRLRFGDDFRRITAPCRMPIDQPLPDGVTYRTPFGVDRTGFGYGQPVSHPLAGATTTREILDYSWPDPTWVDVSALLNDAQPWRGSFAILGGDWSPFWHDAIDLVGMENLYLQMQENPELVDLLLRKLVDYYFASSVRIFDAAAKAIDIFFIGNDFGGQTGPLLSPAMFERYMLPHLERLVGLGRDYGLLVQLHCCGGIEPLIPFLIRAGFDGIHAIQPSCGGMDLAHLKRAYGDKILFNGAIDSHHVLIDGDADYVRRETERILRIMTPGGGYVAGASHDTILEETPVENVVAMFDTVRDFKE